MTTTIGLDAELTRLARVLGTDPAELQYLTAVGPDALRQARLLVLDQHRNGEDDLVGQLAAITALAPAPVAAKIVEQAVPPQVAAALVGTIEDDRAARIASRLAPDYLAECALALDPRRAGTVLPGLPVDVLLPVTQRLFDREEYLTLGSLVARLPDERLRDLTPAAPDAGLLRLAGALEDASVLDRLFALVPDRLAGIVAAAAEHGLWREVLDVAGHLNDANRGLVADLVARLDDPALADLCTAVTADGLGGQLLDLAAAGSETARRRLVSTPAARRPETIDLLVGAAVADARWTELLRLADVAPVGMFVRTTHAVGDLDEPALDGLIAAGRAAGLSGVVVRIAGQLPPDVRPRLAGRPGFADADGAAEIVRTAVRQDSWDEVLPLVAGLPEEAKARVAANVGDLGDGDLTGAAVAAGGSGGLEHLLGLAADMPLRARDAILTVVADPGSAFGQVTPLLDSATSPETWAQLGNLGKDLPHQISSLSARASAVGVPAIGRVLATLNEPEKVASLAGEAVQRTQDIAGQLLSRLRGTAATPPPPEPRRRPSPRPRPPA